MNVTQEVKYPVRLEGELLRELSRSVGDSQLRLEHVGRERRNHLEKDKKYPKVILEGNSRTSSL